MKVAEFKKEHDRFLAFNSWVSIKEAKDQKMIPEKYWNYFSDYCVCGSENMISSNLKRCKCCDPKCDVKYMYMFASFMKKSKCDNFGYSNCKTVYDAFMSENKIRIENLQKGISEKRPLFVYNHFLELFTIDWQDYPIFLQSTSVGLEFYQCAVRLQSDSLTFPQLMSRLSLPGLDNDALKLFKGCCSFQDFINKVKQAGGLQRFCASKGIYAAETLSTIVEYFLDMGIADTIFGQTLRQEGIQVVKICITGSVRLAGESMTKACFVQKLNELCIDKNGVPLYEFMLSSAVQSTPFIVYSSESNSAKFRAGKTRGEITDSFGTHKVLIKPDELVQLLTDRMKLWNAEH